MLNQLSINVPLVETLEQMPGYAKFMKDLVTKKTSVTFEDDDRLQHCTAIATRSLVQKKEDPGAFTISCTVRSLHFAKAVEREKRTFKVFFIVANKGIIVTYLIGLKLTNLILK